jgi:hypothetical protein
MSDDASVSDYPRLGDIVYYFDEDKQPHAAIVAHIWDDRTDAVTERPVCNLAIFKHDGRIAARVEVEPAYDNGERWVLINKWPDEVPPEQYNYRPAPKMRIRRVGLGETLVP